MEVQPAWRGARQARGARGWGESAAAIMDSPDNAPDQPTDGGVTTDQPSHVEGEILVEAFGHRPSRSGKAPIIPYCPPCACQTLHKPLLYRPRMPRSLLSGAGFDPAAESTKTRRPIDVRVEVRCDATSSVNLLVRARIITVLSEEAMQGFP